LSEPTANPLFGFCSFVANLETGQLLRHGHRIRLQEKPFLILVALLERRGELVTREELHQRLWPDNTFVDFDHNLNNAVNKLREALNDSVEKPRFIETIPRKGYRFISRLEVVSTESIQESYAETAAAEEVSSAPNNGNGTSEIEAIPLGGATELLAAQEKPWVGRLRPGRAAIVIVSAALLAGALVFPLLRKGNAPRSRRAPIVTAQTTRYAFVTDYSQSAVWAYSVNPSTGILEPVGSTPFKSGEHSYQAVLTPGLSFLYVANRGRADGVCGKGCNISGYAVDHVSGRLAELDGSPYLAGSGPVAISMHPSGEFVYVVNVISNDLYAYARDSNGDLKQTGPAHAVGTHPFFVTTNPSGQFLYVSNQDDGTISAFTTGKGDELKPVPGSPFNSGLRPRSITIDPTGHFVYVVNYGVNPYESHEAACVGTYANASGKGCTISVFEIDQKTGALAPIKDSPFESDGINPLMSVMDSYGKYLFVVNVTSNDISVFEADDKTGSIRRVAGSPFSTARKPISVALDWSDSLLYVVSGSSHNISQFAVEDDGRLHSIGTPVPAGLGPTSIVAQRGSK
jgi:DNA-binding winged helix-turn-helix (wHTH) protein/6-phosphogluconolactonase (cycloisomerase 2 family)